MNIYMLLDVLIMLTVLVGGVVAWNISKHLDDTKKKNDGGRIAIKVDFKGRYHYDLVPNSGNTNLLFWVRLCIVIVTLVLAALPFQSIIQRS